MRGLEENKTQTGVLHWAAALVAVRPGWCGAGGWCKHAVWRFRTFQKKINLPLSFDSLPPTLVFFSIAPFFNHAFISPWYQPLCYKQRKTRQTHFPLLSPSSTPLLASLFNVVRMPVCARLQSTSLMALTFLLRHYPGLINGGFKARSLACLSGRLQTRAKAGSRCATQKVRVIKK